MSNTTITRRTARKGDLVIVTTREGTSCVGRIAAWGPQVLSITPAAPESPEMYCTHHHAHWKRHDHSTILVQVDKLPEHQVDKLPEQHVCSYCSRRATHVRAGSGGDFYCLNHSAGPTGLTELI